MANPAAERTDVPRWMWNGGYARCAPPTWPPVNANGRLRDDPGGTVRGDDGGRRTAECGDHRAADAPVTVLLVHGWTCSTRSLAQPGRGRCRGSSGRTPCASSAYDHRGHGRSDAAPTGSHADRAAGGRPGHGAGCGGRRRTGRVRRSLDGRDDVDGARGRRPELFGSRIAAAALVSTSSGQISSGRLRHPQTPRPGDCGRRAARGEPGEREGRASGELAVERQSRSAAGCSGPPLRQMVFGKKVDPAEVDLFLADLAAVPGSVVRRILRGDPPARPRPRAEGPRPAPGRDHARHPRPAPPTTPRQPDGSPSSPQPASGCTRAPATCSCRNAPET